MFILTQSFLKTIPTSMCSVSMEATRRLTPSLKSEQLWMKPFPVLAALDVIWTLLSAQAGQMRELNPLAARLLGQPDALLTFKLACTVGPAALIFALRRHRAAQLAAWWMCFITTLVACRWVVQTAAL